MILRALVLLLPLASLAAPTAALRYDFGSGPAAPGWIGVDASTRFTSPTGFGFEAGAELQNSRSEPAPMLGDQVGAVRGFHFTARLPHEGNYRVTVTFRGSPGAEPVWVKAELRRLVANPLRIPEGETRSLSFVVNTRRVEIAPRDGIPAGRVRLKAPRETVQEAWAWDDALTLEFLGAHPSVCGVEIAPVDVPTVYLLGDSTVCDQSKEPYASWGQMLPRLFGPGIAVANHGESGETYRDSIGRRRLDKILSLIRPGDWVLLQFGHNDQKQVAAGTGGPFTTYQEEIRRHVEPLRARGAQVILVTPMERRGFDASGHVLPSLRDYAEATRRSAAALGVPCIDLNHLSRRFYEALGPERSATAFAAPEGKVDNTHHNNYGADQLARGVAQALRDLQLPLATHLATDFPAYDPSHPLPPEACGLVPSLGFTNQRPLGDEGRP